MGSGVAVGSGVSVGAGVGTGVAVGSGVGNSAIEEPLQTIGKSQRERCRPDCRYSLPGTQDSEPESPEHAAKGEKDGGAERAARRYEK